MSEEINYTEITWKEREKYGCIGHYVVNRDIYHDMPSSWKQVPKLKHKKGTMIKVVKYKYRDVFEEQFHTNLWWFKREQITPISTTK